jgi:radical SAM protein with 4Fe4S-binding SPASM domain
MAKYGVRMPQIVDAPFLVVWDFTHLCNLRCKHCYLGAKERMEGELTTEEGKKLIDELRDIDVLVLAFSGGEPLMRRDFFELADYAHKNDLYVTLATNGTLITRNVAKKIKDSGVEYVEISLDGKDADTHDSFRGVPGMFDRAIEGIKNCMDQGLQTGIATTVTKHNYDQIEEIYDLASDLGVKRFICFNFVPTSRGIDIIEDDISPEWREELLKFLLERTHEGEMECLSTAPQLARVAIEEEKGVPVGHFYIGSEFESKTRALADFIGGCGAGRLYCSIEPNGDVQPCVFLPIKCGNIRENSLSNIWHESPIFKGLRDRSSLKGHCSKCENKFVCGGCRARGWAYFKDLNAPDPGCIKNQNLSRADFK